MQEFDIEERKNELNLILDDLEKDITELKHRIEEARVDLLYVTTYEEAMKVLNISDQIVLKEGADNEP